MTYLQRIDATLEPFAGNFSNAVIVDGVPDDYRAADSVAPAAPTVANQQG